MKCSNPNCEEHNQTAKDFYWRTDRGCLERIKECKRCISKKTKQKREEKKLFFYEY